jgi:hypothetical protein
MVLCQFHRITQKLADPDHFGSDHVSPTIYDRILATLNSIARCCETRREATITIQCLLAYGRSVKFVFAAAADREGGGSDAIRGGGRLRAHSRRICCRVLSFHRASVNPSISHSSLPQLHL